MGGKVVISYSRRGGVGEIITTLDPASNPIRVFKKILNPAHPRLPCSYTRPNKGESGQVTWETREIAIPTLGIGTSGGKLVPPLSSI